MPDNCSATLNGKSLKFSAKASPYERLGDYLSFLFVLDAPAAVGAGENRFEFADLNFVDRKRHLKIDVTTDKTFRDLANRDIAERSVEPEANDDLTATAVFASPTAGDAAAPPPVIDEPAPAAKPTLWRSLADGDLTALLDADHALFVLLLLAALHGAVHSLMPGHGKTMVAAYLVGERGTPFHAVLLGIVTTLTHTSSALLVALLLHYGLKDADPARVQATLGVVGGLLIVFVGIWLLLQRLAGKSDHVHLFAGHSHAHGHAHSHGLPAKAGLWRVVLLGIAGGILPCWGAVLWLLACSATGRLGIALPVLLAFSAGLASVLVALGLSVVWGGRVGASRFGDARWFKGFVRWFPVVGSVGVIVIGFLLCRSAVNLAGAGH